MLKTKTLGFLGGGNMSDAIIKGLINSSFIEAKKIIASDISQSRLDHLNREYKVKITSNNREVVKKSDIIIVSVKPQVIKKVLSEVHDLAHEKKLFISVAAGVPINIMEEILFGEQNKKLGVVRTMPNTPSLVQEGVTAISPGTHVTKGEVHIVHRIFEAIGSTIDVEEEQLDAVTGLSGSGPAYIFMIIEALSDAGVKMGLSREVANILTVQTVLGSAKLVRESGKHPGELKDMVTSPGGTTISGLHTMEAGGVRNSLIDAVEIATERSKELGKNLQVDHTKNEKDT